MSVTNTPISGTGSNADPTVSDVVLDDATTQVADTQVTDDTTTQVDDTTTIIEPGKEGQEPVKEDGRSIPKWVKELQTSNPEAYKKAKADFFETRERRTIHPTVQAAREEHDLIQSIGGREGITTLREDAGVYKTAANQFLKGDPAFVKDLWEEDPIAAALHVAPMLETYRARDFEGYKSTVAKLWDTEFQGVGLQEKGLNPLKSAITSKNTEEALAILADIQGWKDSISRTASKAEDPRVKTLLAERASQRDNAAKSEQETFLKGYKTESVNLVVDEASKTFDSFFRGRKLDPEDRTDLLREAISMANRAVVADKDFMTQQQGHLDNGDKHSAIQLTKARYAREMPNAVQRVARRYGLVSGTAPRQQQQTTQQQQQQPRVEQGWTAVNVRPSPEEIDRSRTPNEMILSGKAILRSGKKVDWSALKKV
jgi:hypothetical protein